MGNNSGVHPLKVPRRHDAKDREKATSASIGCASPAKSKIRSSIPRAQHATPITTMRLLPNLSHNSRVSKAFGAYLAGLTYRPTTWALLGGRRKESDVPASFPSSMESLARFLAGNGDVLEIDDAAAALEESEEESAEASESKENQAQGECKEE